MYKIITPSGESFLTEKANFIRVHSNGVYILTDATHAEGVAHHGTPYLFKDGAFCFEIDGGESADAVETMLNYHELKSAALEFRQALQYFIRNLTDEAEIMEVASVFPDYQAGKAYKTKDVFVYGRNGVGDPQLYQVLQDHTSSEEWTPDTAMSLYKPIGVTDSGYPEWVQPLGASDAYNNGDIVSYNGVLYKSLIDGNTWSPEAYPQGWEEVKE